MVRGYRSALDESVQPVRVTIPDEYDEAPILQRVKALAKPAD